MRNKYVSIGKGNRDTVLVQSPDSALYDSFGRVRTADPQAVFYRAAIGLNIAGTAPKTQLVVTAEDLFGSPDVSAELSWRELF